jgi:hypothetical protein
MTTDLKFLEGYATVMKQNNVSPVEAFQLMQKEAAIPWKALGLIAAGGLGTAGLGYGASKIGQAIKNKKRDFELYNEGLDSRGAVSSSSQDNPALNNFQNWSNLPSSSSTTTKTSPSTTSPSVNIDPLTARRNAMERRHYDALAYSADTKLKEQQRKYDEGMQSFTTPSALTTIASRIPGVSYLTDLYSTREAERLNKSKNEIDALRKQLEEYRANSARYK